MRQRLFGQGVFLAALFILGVWSPASAGMKLAILEVKGMVCPS
jgi:hypothetical protein